MREESHTVTNPVRRSIMNFQDFIQELFRQHSFKAASALFGGYLLMHLLPIAHFILIGVLLVTCDWITGVWAAYNRREKITSKGLRRTVEKVLFYSMAIFLVMVVESAFFASHFVVAMVALYICMVELFSNLENISSITGTNIIDTVRSEIFERFPVVKKMFDRTPPPPPTTLPEE
jgi:phage-related holin